jgi:hypothetical protein
MRWLCAAMLAGCYAPSPVHGLPCSSGGDCPAGQSCDTDRQLCSPLPTDAALDVAGAPADSFVFDPGPPWSAMQPIIAINTASYETDPALSPDGLELFFSSDRPGTVGALDVYRSTRATTADPFGAPLPVAELQTAGDDYAVEIASDGLTIYFRRQNDIYRARRASRSTPFTNITHDTELSTAMVDSNPALSGDLRIASTTREGPFGVNKELLLFTRSNRNQPWGTPRALDELSTTADESASVLDQTGTRMMFHSDRPGSVGATDIYFTARPSTSAMFLPPVPISEINTAVIESDPSLDATWSILVIERQNDIYIATR